MTALTTALENMDGSVTFARVVRASRGEPKVESTPTLVISRGAERKGRENRGYVCQLPILLSITASSKDAGFADESTEVHANALISQVETAVLKAYRTDKVFEGMRVRNLELESNDWDFGLENSDLFEAEVNVAVTYEHSPVSTELVP